jgi:transcriptional regulator with XRE-family HTH domain
MEKTFPGHKLRELRESKGMTQNQLDDVANLKRGSVRDYEQGIRQPQWGRVIALCEALGVSCESFTALHDATTDPAPPVEKPKRGRPAKAKPDEAGEGKPKR